ncbi:hypothetical protein Syun_008029 [Stephania yunnanensis]|uniref:Uncharacterized protein n=1 Tax=Stephania yunnanensis TaxID=152371 RepID=A0AAP0L0Z6_9MAGN
MEAIVAYNLLVWAYRDGPWRRSPPPQRVYRKKAYEMVLILNNESAKSSDEQTKLISDLLYGVSDHMVCDLLVFVISKLFPEFVVRWKGVVFYSKPAKIYVDSRVGSSSSIDVKVIDTLVVFTWIVFHSLRFWDYDEGADHEEEGDSGAFEESENKLRSAGASAPQDGPDHHRGEGNGDRPVEAEGSRAKAHRNCTTPEQTPKQSYKPAQQGVADIDVLWILKSDHRFNTPLHKRVEVEKLFNPIGDQVFEQMLLTMQCITDTSHPYRLVAHNDMPITTMEDVVAYNLLIQVYGHDRDSGEGFRYESCRRRIDAERGAWSGGFEESQNELGNIRRRYMPHDMNNGGRVIQMVTMQ